MGINVRRNTYYPSASITSAMPVWAWPPIAPLAWFPDAGEKFIGSYLPRLTR